jgi:RimK family alpha-L-glutamate ligase
MKIGVFGNPDSWYVGELCRTGELRSHTVHRLQFTDLNVRVRSGSVEVCCGDHDLNQLDAVFVRTMPPGTLEQVVARMDLLSCLMERGVPVINSPRALECAVDKYLTTQKLSLAGLPVPDTIVCENSETAMLAFESLGGDIVIKPIFGAEGRGIMRVSDPELALRAFRTLERLGAVIYAQRFLNGPGFDLRLLLLDGELLGAMKRIPRPGDFRANISQAGTGVPHEATEHELQLAQQAASVTGCRFAGIDLMYQADGQPVIIEVNAVPGWKGLQSVCGIDVPARVFQSVEDSSRR